MTILASERDGQDRGKPGPILLLGAPGVGKGTQARLLMADFLIPQISTGDILREQIHQGTELGMRAKWLMDRGELVPDDVVNAMVADRLSQKDVADGYILDGYPRTLGQAEWLDNFLDVAGSTSKLVALSLLVGDQELLRRITGRRSCSTCGHIYNIFTRLPEVEGFCDLDGSPLTQRSDDTEEAFRARMLAYRASTAPVIDHYRAVGRFAEVDGAQEQEVVTESLRDALATLREWGA